MTGAHRDTEWRQGALFQIPGDDATPSMLGIVASHDCDICADTELEPNIEYIPVTSLDSLNGSFTLGKNPRRLQAAVHADDENQILVEIDIRKRTATGKDAFISSAKLFTHQLQEREVVVYKRWLSARYNRSAFANAFEARMVRVAKPIAKLAEKKGAKIRALHFDVDENLIIERVSEDDPYELAIYVVYPPDVDDGIAENFSKELSDIFKKEFFEGEVGKWTGIELISCDPVAEDNFPVALAYATKTWRVDDRSYKGLPADGLFPEPDR